MANRHRGELAFEAGDVTYTLQFSHQALICLEEKLDKSLLQIMNDVMSWTKSPENMRVTMIRDMMWAGLQRHHKMTPEEASEVLDDLDGGAGRAAELIAEAMQRAFNPEKKGGNPTQPAATAATTNGTGQISGSSGSASDKTQTGSGSSLPANTD